jgi:CubicO group peptidase (beta-lactamase class C family)
MARVEADSKAGRPPGAVLLVARDGKLQYANAVGVQDPATGRPMARDTIFRIYSMTKPIVSNAVMQLVEDGRLRLGDPVWQYVPELKGMQVAVEKPGPDGRPAIVERVAAPREMTVQDLLRRTSGLTYAPFGRSAVKDEYAKAEINPGLRQLPFDLSEMARRLGKVPLAFARGSAYLPGPGHGFGLGFAVRNGSGESAWYGSPGDYYWGGYAGTAFWVDPKERLVAVWMMQGPAQSAQCRPLLRAALYTSLDR